MTSTNYLGGSRVTTGGNHNVHYLNSLSSKDAIATQFVQQALSFAELTSDDEVFSKIESLINRAGSVENIIKNPSVMAILRATANSSLDPMMQKAGECFSDAHDSYVNGVAPAPQGNSTRQKQYTASSYLDPITGEIVVSSSDQGIQDYKDDINNNGVSFVGLKLV